MIGWQYEICHFLQLDPNASDNEVFQELQTASVRMEEAERVKQNPATHQGPPRYEVIHRVHCAFGGYAMYLEQPWVVSSSLFRSHLRGSQQLSNTELYLERNKDVVFLVVREYQCCVQQPSQTMNRYHLGKEEETQPASMLRGEHIDIVSEDLRSRLASLSTAVLQGIPHPKFSNFDDDEDDLASDHSDESNASYHNDRVDATVCYPYLWFYHRRFKISEAIDHLEDIDQESLSVFCGYIHDRMSDEWAAVDSLISKGEITAEYIKYIYVSLLTNSLVLVSDRQRSQARSSSGHPKTAPKPKSRLL